MKKLPQGEELEKYAVKLGVSFHNLSDPNLGIDESDGNGNRDVHNPSVTA